MDNKVIKIGLLGLGTVGTGVYKLIGRRSDEMEQKIGANLEIEKILVHNLKKTRHGIEQSLLTDRWEDIIGNEEIRIVIEAMGGIEPARTMILEAIAAGKSVVQDAVEALVALGYGSTESLKAVRSVNPDEHMDVETVLKAALKHLF